MTTSSFESLDLLIARFRALGARRVFFKVLSENDNSKQQIYLGGSFEALTIFPHGDVRAFPEVRVPNFKAGLSLWWVDAECQERAPEAQLILYPTYPEVRLSGFLRGCPISPGVQMRPIPRGERRGQDGRVLFFGTTADGRTLAHLAVSGSALANEALGFRTTIADARLFTEIPLPGTVAGDSREQLIEALRDIQARGFVDSVRLNREGVQLPYGALNGGGYTLEALLGIRPNGNAEPDYLGWEVKGYCGDRLTLMTPEPDGGYYREQSVRGFLLRYGRDIPAKDQRYFTGIHRFRVANTTTGMRLDLAGYDTASGKMVAADGAIQLIASDGAIAASWSFSSLLTHWNRKHASAVYVPYVREPQPPRYRYTNPLLLGERTDFAKYLSAVAAGTVFFDPGSKMDGISSGRPTVKARSQFRTSKRNLGLLYESFEEVNLSQTG